MKLFLLALFLALFTAAFSYTLGGVYKHPDHPGKCFYSDELVLSPGEVGYPKGNCVRFMCGKDSFGGIHGCGTIIAGPPFKLGDYINRDAPYPECCERHIIKA